MKHSPPNRFNIESSMAKTSSEPDLTSTPIGTQKRTFVTRNKRQRPEEFTSPKSDSDEEVKVMLKSVMKDLKEVKTQNSDIIQSNSEIKAGMEFVNKMYEDMKLRIETLEKLREKDREYIHRLEDKLKDIELASRSSALEIRNIPGSSKETCNDLMSTVCNIGKVLGSVVVPSDFRDTYRLPTKGSVKPIVVEFSSVHKRDDFLSSAKRYNKNKELDDKLNTKILGISDVANPVFIAEYLSPSLKKLFYLSKQFAKNNDYKYCWAVNGRIYLRKETGSELFRILSERSLLSLPQKPNPTSSYPQPVTTP